MKEEIKETTRKTQNTKKKEKSYSLRKEQEKLIELSNEIQLKQSPYLYGGMTAGAY